MLISPHTSLLQQWKQKQHLLAQLQAIANSPITASPLQREDLQRHFTDFIYTQTFDSLFGGLLVMAENNQGENTGSDRSEILYHKPIITSHLLKLKS